jgi:TPR repeat protein
MRLLFQGFLMGSLMGFLAGNAQAGAAAGGTNVMIPGGIPGGAGTIPAVPQPGGAIIGSPAIDPTTGLPPINPGGGAGGTPQATNNIPAPQVQIVITEEMYEEAKRVFIENAKKIRKEAEAGDERQQHNLGVLYTLGYGVPLDHQQAFSWFNQAAKKGLKESQLNVAIALQGGLGTKKDMVVSYKYYILSAAQGMRDAAIARDHLAQYLNRDQIETGQRMARGFIKELERRENLAKRRAIEEKRMNAIKKGLDPNDTPGSNIGGGNNN